jgi:hypothetical protein
MESRGKMYSSLFFCGASTRLRVIPSPYEASRSHSYTLHSIRLLCTSDKPEALNSPCQNITLTKSKISMPRRDSNPQFQQAAADPRLRLRGNRDRRLFMYGFWYILFVEIIPRFCVGVWRAANCCMFSARALETFGSRSTGSNSVWIEGLKILYSVWDLAKSVKTLIIL